MKKIDVHLHLANVIAGYGFRGESRSAGNGQITWANGDTYQLLPEGFGEDKFLAEDALKIMDAHDVEKAVLMEGSMYGFQNRYYETLLKKYPERFAPACTVDPFMRGHLDNMHRFFEEVGFHIAKFEVSTGGGLMGANDPFLLDGPRFSEIAKVVNDNKGVLVLDLGDPTMDSHQILAVMRLADKNPDMKLVCCHLLAPQAEYHREWRAELSILARENVYFDFSAVPNILDNSHGGAYPYPDTCRHVLEAVEILGEDRLMWGSDAPFAATRDSYEHLAEYLTEAEGFTPELLQKLYYDNAQHVYFER